MASNLFQPGDPRINRKGRPKGTAIDRLKKLADKVMTEKVDTHLGKITRAELVFRAMAAKAVKGDVKAADFIFMWTYGKPSQPVEVSAATNTLQDLLELARKG